MAAPADVELSTVDQIQRLLGASQDTPNEDSTETPDSPGQPERLRDERGRFTARSADSSIEGEGETSGQGGEVSPDSPDTEESDGDTPADDGAEPFDLTLEFLAKQLEIPEDELGKHLKVKGRDGTLVPLADALESYRNADARVLEAEKMTPRVRELEEAETQRRTEYQSRMGELQQLSLALLHQLEATQRTPEQWAQLRETNPTQWLEERMRFEERRGLFQRAAETQREYQARAQAEQQRVVAEYQRAEAQKLRDAVPEWKSDAGKFRAGLEEIETYLKGQGFTDADLADTADHRMWLIARKAMQFDQLPAKKEALEKRLRALPKLVRPGSPRPPDKTNIQGRQRALSAHRETGTVDSAAAAILESMRSNRRSR